MHSLERSTRTMSGWGMLFLDVALFFASIWLLVAGIRNEVGAMVVSALLLLTLSTILACGFYVVQPNQAAVLILFGRYRGSAKENGFWWTNPFVKRVPISLRARTLNSEKLKVNEARGNPIEIGAVVVWEVRDTAQARFDVEDYLDYVRTQSETAMRKLASAYPYDGPEDIVSLRGATDEVNHHLQEELQQRLNRAGVNVIEARLSNIAYAPEIAGAMLQRQQAEAVVAARFKIVEGACGMVEDALDTLSKRGIVDLDSERRAAMVSNLMVVLCGDHSTHPVVNVGTLYN